jgi:predicted dithiol-disulfide oxidoreductase (DUF899 family)
MNMQTNPTAIKEVDDQVNAIEAEIMELKQKISKVRKTRPLEPVQDYQLTNKEGAPVKLSELFGDKTDLLLIHNMGQGCSYCTLWADGFNGELDHLESRAAFVVVSPNSPEQQQTFAEKRGWKFKMASSAGTTFTEDLGFVLEPGSTYPGISAFHKDEAGQIFRTGKAFFGPGDDFCGVWPMIDLLKGGEKGWEPKYNY